MSASVRPDRTGHATIGLIERDPDDGDEVLVTFTPVPGARPLPEVEYERILVATIVRMIQHSA